MPWYLCNWYLELLFIASSYRTALSKLLCLEFGSNTVCTELLHFKCFSLIVSSFLFYFSFSRVLSYLIWNRICWWSTNIMPFSFDILTRPFNLMKKNNHQKRKHFLLRKRKMYVSFSKTIYAAFTFWWPLKSEDTIHSFRKKSINLSFS